MPSICSLSMHVLTCKPTSSQGNRCAAPPCPSSPLAPRVARLSFLVLECPLDRQPLLPSRIAGHPMRGAACSGDGGAGSAAGRQQGPDRCVGAGLWPAGPVQLVQEALGVDLGQGRRAASGTGIMFVRSPCGWEQPLLLRLHLRAQQLLFSFPKPSCVTLKAQYMSPMPHPSRQGHRAARPGAADTGV